MIQTITITPHWQIHLPVLFRRKLGLKEPGKMEMKLIKNTITITPQKSAILSMAGKYKKIKPKKPIQIERVREKIDYSHL